MALPILRNRGFSLIELLVVIAILIFVGSVLLYQGSGSQGDLEVTNAAYDVALLIREAQVYGGGVREGNQGSQNFNDSYGVGFLASIPTKAHLFIDSNSNQLFDAGELIKEVALPKRITVTNFCGTLSTGVTKCSSTGDITSLLAVFVRPSPDAILVGMPGNLFFASADITITGLEGKTRTVNVLSTGQIAVER